jgi:hypothetical protein
MTLTEMMTTISKLSKADRKTITESGNLEQKRDLRIIVDKLPQDLSQTLYPILLAKEKVICDFSSGLEMERLVSMLNCM